MPRKFSSRERAILEIVQDNLPFSPRPFAEIAARTGASEAEVLGLLRELRESGAIRRFGASIRHQLAGWNWNAMVAWVAAPEEAEICGPIAAKHPHVSHAYFRPSNAPDWPYTFYTMTHGRSEAEGIAAIGELAESLRLREYAILRSVRELKKTSMTYFTRDDGNG